MSPTNEPTETTATQTAATETAGTETAAPETKEVSAEVLSTLAEIGEEVNASLDLDEVLARTRGADQAAHRLRNIRRADGRRKRRLSQDTDFLSAIRRSLRKICAFPSGRELQERRRPRATPVRVSDVSKYPRYINAIDSVRSELAVPLMLRGKCVGVLDIQSRQPDYFTPEQQSILTLLASRLAVAIENARLFQRVRTQAETLLVLNEVGRETSSILDVEELLRRAAELIKRVIDYQILSIMLYDEESESIPAPRGRETRAARSGKNARGGDGRNCGRGGGH